VVVARVSVVEVLIIGALLVVVLAAGTIAVRNRRPPP